MKQIIVMIASIALGLFLFSLIIGPEDTSLYSVTKGVWKEQIEQRAYQP